MKISKDFIMRDIAGECVVVPTGAAASRFNGLITLNEVAQFIWKQLQEEVTEEQILEAIMGEFDVSEEEARTDVTGFVAALRENGFLEE